MELYRSMNPLVKNLSVKNKKVLGIDLSINSTGLCLIETNPLGRTSTHYWNIISNSKYGKGVLQKLLELAEASNDIDIELYQRCGLNDDYNVSEHSKQKDIESILFHVVNIINSVEPTKVVLEGLSFASRNTNSLTTLSGLHHLVRTKCDVDGIEWQVVTPSELKKFATGKGNADKELMIKSWLACEPHMELFPIDDLADAFFLSKIGC